MDVMVPARRFRRGELVFSQSQPATALFILKIGRIRIFSVAETLEDVTTRQLSVDEVERFLLTDSRIAVPILPLLGEQVSRLEERLTDLALKPLTAQVAATLLKLSKNIPQHLFSHGRTVHLTHEQLPGLLGASREATSKIMGELTAKNAVRQGRGRIHGTGSRPTAQHGCVPRMNISTLLRRLKMTTRPFPRKSRKTLHRRWEELPEHVKTPGQSLGCVTVGCEGTHGVLPKCDLTCSPC